MGLKVSYASSILVLPALALCHFASACPPSVMVSVNCSELDMQPGLLFFTQQYGLKERNRLGKKKTLFTCSYAPLPNQGESIYTGAGEWGFLRDRTAIQQDLPNVLTQLLGYLVGFSESPLSETPNTSFPPNTSGFPPFDSSLVKHQNLQNKGEQNNPETQTLSHDAIATTLEFPQPHFEMIWTQGKPGFGTLVSWSDGIFSATKSNEKSQVELDFVVSVPSGHPEVASTVLQTRAASQCYMGIKAVYPPHELENPRFP